ncbi:trypsin-like peptidase domain-containing protein [Gordonia sp. CPCC 205333]|uniref:trypsin-like peptidase domain-containing protein n=1 Tax=Gordonia sp. CPCC 205333 TaxID=3140790 RepID=UPI003AF407E8
MRQAHIGLTTRRTLVTLCVALLAALVAAPAAQAAPDKSISAQVGPSIVFIRTVYKAYVQVPLRSGTVWTPEMSLTSTCTGYAVDTKGSIATAGHCVNGKDEEIANAFREKTIELLASELKWSDTEATANYKAAVAAKWPVSGSTSDSSSGPSRAVSVQQPSGAGQVLTDWVDAEVVDFQTFDDGDNAVLRIGNQSLVPLAISPNEPQPGEAITAVGFPGAVRIVTDTSIIPQPSYKTGTVSSRQVTGNGVTKTEISAGMGQGMSGGPTVDAAGNVIGTNSSVTKDETASFDFITDNLALRSYLESHGVVLAAPHSDESESGKSNMWLWLGPLIGVAAVLVLLVLVLLIRRSRKRKAQRGFGYPGGPFGPGGAAGPQQPFGGAVQPFGQSGAQGPRPVFGPGGPAQGGSGFGQPQPQPRPQQFAPNPQQPQHRGPGVPQQQPGWPGPQQQRPYPGQQLPPNQQPGQQRPVQQPPQQQPLQQHPAQQQRPGQQGPNPYPPNPFQQ